MSALNPDDTILLDVENSISGDLAEIELPKHEPMRVLIPAIAQQLHMQPAGIRMRNKTQGFPYSDMDTLASTGTMEHDFCQLSGIPVHG